MMSRFSLVFSLVAALLFSLSLPAQAADMKAPVIAVVDIQKIVKESKAGQEIQAEMDKQSKTLVGELNGLQDEWRNVEEELKRQQAIMTQDAFAEKVREYEQRRNGDQRRLQSVKRELDQAFEQAFAEIVQHTRSIAENIARDKGIQIVLTKNQVLLIDNNLDITESVLAELNKKLPELEISIPKTQ